MKTVLLRVRKWQIFFGCLFVVLLISIDQLTKQLAVLFLKDAPAVPLISGVFELQYLENHGAAFGILQGKKVLFVILTLIIVAVLIYLYIRIPDTKHYDPMRAAIVLLISGALGNFIDRCSNSYVVDFFYFRLIDFPIFNVADIYVVCAAISFVLLFCFYYKEEDLDQIYALFSFSRKKIAAGKTETTAATASGESSGRITPDANSQHITENGQKEG